jgi:hypothetical protein
MPRRDYIAGELSPDMLQALKELNFECLELLAAQSRAASRRDFPLAKVIEIWNGLDNEARDRAIDYPYLLFNAGFAEPQRWRRPAEQQINEERGEPYETFFTVPAAVQVAHQVFVHAWSTAREHVPSAVLTLGMHPQCAKIIAAHTSVSLYRTVERHWTWLRPRWLDRPQVWQELLLGGMEGGEARASALMHGLQLVAAEITTATRKRREHFRV